MRPLLALIALLSVAACETVKGAGQDIEKAGEAITDQAQETQADL